MVTPFKRLYDKEAILSHLKAIGARAFVHIKDAEKLDPKSWEGILCGFSEKEAISCQIWNPKTRKVVKSRNVTFIEISPDLIPQVTRLSSLRGLPSVELNNDYASHDDLMWDARDHTAVLDLNVNIPAAHANVESVDGSPEIAQFFRQSTTPRERTCSYHKPRPGVLRLWEPRPGKVRPGEHCRRYYHLIWRWPLSRHPLRHHEEQWRDAPRVQRRAANLCLRTPAQQVCHCTERHATRQSTWRRFSKRIRCTTCGRSPSTSTPKHRISPSGECVTLCRVRLHLDH